MSRIGWSTRRRVQGFSLLELVICLSIISLFLSVVIVRIDALTGFGDLSEAARIVIAEITKRRGEAAYSHAEKVLGLHLETGWIYPVEVEGRESGNEEKTEAKSENQGDSQSIRKRRELPKGVSLIDIAFYPDKSITEGEARIRFFPNGCTDEALIHLKNEQGEFCTLELLSYTGEVVVHHRNVQIEEQKQRLYPVRDHSLSGAHLYSASGRI